MSELQRILNDDEKKAFKRFDKRFEMALNLLLDYASHDTGGSRRAAGFLLSLWNGGTFHYNFQDVLYVDQTLFDAVQLVMNYIYLSGNQLYTYVSEQQMAPILDRWGNVFNKHQANLNI